MFLGVDLGTTKVAAVIADASGRLLADAAQDHGADLAAAPGRSEQDAEHIIALAWELIVQLPASLRAQVRAVGITGQMHGVVMVDDGGSAVAPLITWQDQRCLEDPGWLDAVNEGLNRPLRTGFGCATLGWLAAHQAPPVSATAACTIHDLAVARLCGQARPTTDPSDAASWGLFDLTDLRWDLDRAIALGIPTHLLPRVVPCGAQVGVVTAAMAKSLGIPAGVPVAAATGDNQASLLATLQNPTDEIALTLGTGGQVSVVLDAAEALMLAESHPACEPRPFPGHRMILVGACLCGGSAWAWLADSIAAWQRDLGLPAPERDALFARLNELGLQSPTEVMVHPHFLGERHAPTLRGAIEQLNLENFQLGALARGLARGIMTNLKHMLPAASFSGRKRIMASGNALRRNPLLHQMVQDVFGLPTVMMDTREEAALGAARVARCLWVGTQNARQPQ